MIRQQLNFNKMKVAFISLNCYDLLNKDTVLRHHQDPDYFDRETIANHWDVVHKRVAMLYYHGIDIELWYLAGLSKGTKLFKHRLGHNMRRISGFRTGKYLSKFLDCEASLLLFRELKRNQITHVLFINYLMNANLLVDMSDLLILFCRLNHIFVFPVFGGWTIDYYGFLKLRSKLFFLKRADGFISESQSELKIMVDKYGYPPEKVLYFLNPVDLENFTEIPKRECAEYLHLDSGKKNILYVGRLIIEKGIHHLIGAMPRVIKEFPDIELIIIGEGKYKQNLIDLAQGLKVETHIRMLGAIDNRSLKYYYNFCDCLVAPSIGYEGTIGVLAEAIACNAKCVGSRIGGIPDLLEDNVGILVPPGDEDGLYEAIMRVLKGGFEINQPRRKWLLSQMEMKPKAKTLVDFLVERSSKKTD
jgi:glycosyltransferase involved in cell wall biosynthesis